MVHKIAVLTMLVSAHSFSLWAQPKFDRPPSQLEYFQYLFTSLGDSSRPAAELQQRRQMYIERMKLDPSEVSALDDAIANFRPSLLTLRQQAVAVLRNKAAGTGLSESENQAAGALLTVHQARIAELGDRFLRAVRPETAQKVRLAIERKPY